MSYVKFVLILVLAARASAWTVDLAEVNKLIVDNIEVVTSGTNNIETVDDQNEVYDATEYAKDYEYQNYEEKKMNDVILNGSDYLEGLSNALAEYSDVLEICIKRKNATEPKRFEKKDQISEEVYPDDVCDLVIHNSNNIRKLTEIVFLTTSKMRDKIDKDRTEDDTGLLVRLAWLLDQLARLTGFEPDGRDTTETSNPFHDSTTEVNRNASGEILEQVENGRPISKLPPTDVTDVKNIQKRSADSPLQEFTNYYLKYKVWLNNNPDEYKGREKEEFDVENNVKLKSVQKRSIKKKGTHLVATDNTKNNIDKPKINMIRHKRIKSDIYKLQSESLKNKYKLQKIKKGSKF